jgi:hypothetical protein
MLWDILRSVNILRPMSIGPLLHFSGYEVSYFVTGNTMWGIMMVVKAFWKGTDGCAKTLGAEKANPEVQ